jgi:hypothetical protein
MFGIGSKKNRFSKHKNRTGSKTFEPLFLTLNGTGSIFRKFINELGKHTKKPITKENESWTTKR